ncbi:MAG: hypothetical protein ACRC5A_09685 [Enterobacteriaceae bacterium]
MCQSQVLFTLNNQEIGHLHDVSHIEQLAEGVKVHFLLTAPQLIERATLSYVGVSDNIVKIALPG